MVQQAASHHSTTAASSFLLLGNLVLPYHLVLSRELGSGQGTLPSLSQTLFRVYGVGSQLKVMEAHAGMFGQGEDIAVSAMQRAKKMCGMLQRELKPYKRQNDEWVSILPPTLPQI